MRLSKLLRGLVAALSLSIVACQSGGPSKRTDAAKASPAVPFRAVGTEPFWALEIDSTGLRFRTPDDTGGVLWPPSSAMVTGDTTRWVAKSARGEIEARIWPGQCSDGMSDRTWEYSAAVRLDTTRYSGCAERRAPRQP